MFFCHLIKIVVSHLPLANPVETVKPHIEQSYVRENSDHQLLKYNPLDRHDIAAVVLPIPMKCHNHPR